MPCYEVWVSPDDSQNIQKCEPSGGRHEVASCSSSPAHFDSHLNVLLGFVGLVLCVVKNVTIVMLNN